MYLGEYPSPNERPGILESMKTADDASIISEYPEISGAIENNTKTKKG